jgi:hypothetical protein
MTSLGTRPSTAEPLKARPPGISGFYFWIVMSPYLFFRIFATSLFAPIQTRLVRHWHGVGRAARARAIHILPSDPLCAAPPRLAALTLLLAC